MWNISIRNTSPRDFSIMKMVECRELRRGTCTYCNHRMIDHQRKWDSVIMKKAQDIDYICNSTKGHSKTALTHKRIKERRKTKMKVKRYSGYAGIRTRTLSGDNFECTKPEHLWIALATSGNMSLVQSAQTQRKSSRLLMWRTMGPKLFWIRNCSFT